jgi:DNA-binding CsgD family transcriptional regulator
MPPKLTNEQLIDLLAAGYNLPQIARMHDMKKFTLDRRMEKLKAKHNCRTAVQLVVKLKTSGVSTSVEETK